MRDALVLPFSSDHSLIVTADNSGGIGLKECDAVHVPHETLSYYSFRVAVMECMAAGGEPIAAVIQNFCGTEAWEGLRAGVRKGMKELGMHFEVTGSTESNIPLLQSALGIMIVGKKMIAPEGTADSEGKKAALIGRPLVGQEVIDEEDWIAPLSLFKWCCDTAGMDVWPVGSKGVAHEWKRFRGDVSVSKADIPWTKSSGPSTCFLISYHQNLETEIRQKAGRHFTEL
ncbi:AIR synthase related protein [Bacillus massiliglaciei]|uniref:AIR synthase related protein n=1 Tax=Bacillus massiliglaciei TaxID=1816693 RepID=UPI000DA6060F|nr:AIR synthase related protein [Bacillus massiliglaciei]